MHGKLKIPSNTEQRQKKRGNKKKQENKKSSWRISRKTTGKFGGQIKTFSSTEKKNSSRSIRCDQPGCRGEKTGPPTWIGVGARENKAKDAGEGSLVHLYTRENTTRQKN